MTTAALASPASLPPLLAIDLADPAGRYRVVAALVLAAVGAAAFARGRTARVVALVAPALAVGGIALAAGADGVAPTLAALTFAVGLAAAALAALARRLGAPGVAGSAVAAVTLWTACGGLWWADRAATLVPPARRGTIREAVLGADPLAAAAYALGYDRLHAPDVYDETTISSTTVRAPDAATTALAWALCGGAAGLGAGLASRRRARPGAPA